MKKKSEFLSENFQFLVFGGEIFNIFEKGCFHNAVTYH